MPTAKSVCPLCYDPTHPDPPIVEVECYFLPSSLYPSSASSSCGVKWIFLGWEVRVYCEVGVKLKVWSQKLSSQTFQTAELKGT